MSENAPTNFGFVDDADRVTYGRVINTLVNLASSFGLVENDREPLRERSALDLLRPFLMDEKIVSEWPGTFLFPGDKVKQYIYDLNDESAFLLITEAEWFFDWDFRHKPGDLHFLRADGTPILVNISGEESVWVSLTLHEHAEWKALGGPALISTADE